MAYQHRTNPSAGEDAGITTKRLSFNSLTGTHGEKPKAVRFIRGPIPFEWMQNANALPGKAGAVSLALWFLSGVKSSMTFAVSAEAEALAACSRQAFSRGLNALAAEGLILIRRKAGARPIITICGPVLSRHHQ
jgi:hypothetical protein